MLLKEITPMCDQEKNAYQIDFFSLLEKHLIFSLAIKNIHNSTLNTFVLLAYSFKLMKSDKLLYQYWLSLRNAFM